jgi:CAAX prenyl protease-like protein
MSRKRESSLSSFETNRPGIGSEPAIAPGPPSDGPPATVPADVIPYAVPLFVYVTFSGIEGYLPRIEGQPSLLWYPLAYAAKVAIVAGLAWRYRSTWKDLAPRPDGKVLVLSFLIGLVVTGIWVGLDGFYPPLPFLGGHRVGFDPNGMRPIPRWGFIGIRMLGLVALVPLIEELFWRSFLIRWLIDQNFQRVPIGRVTPLAVAITSVLFALAHPEWLPALVTGLLWAWLLWWTSSLTSCLVSHITANLALGLYVIMTGEWKYW